MALFDRRDALAVAERVKNASNEIGYICSVVLDDALWAVAHNCGQSRTQIKQYRGRRAYEGRGADDARIDAEGALAELVAGFVLEKAGATLSPLVAHKPDAGGVDVMLGDKRIDVKSIGQGRVYVNVNCKAHVEKPADRYMLVHLVRADIADIYVVDARAVEGWRQTTFLYGVPLDPRRYYWSARLPAGQLPALEPLEEAAEA